MNRLVKILLVIPVLYLIIMPVYLVSSFYSKPCSRIIINIKDSSDYHFVTRRQLLNLVSSNSGRILGKPVKDVKVSEIEKDRKSVV